MSSKEKPTHNCFSQFFLQLRVVMWKNATLKLRFWYILLLELIIPAGFMLALVGIRASISSKTIDAYVPSIPTKFNPSFKDLYRSPDCGGENLIWRCVLKKTGPTCPNLCQPKRIAIAPSSGSSAIEAQNLADWAKFYINIGPLPLNSEPTSWFTYFNSESDFLSYIDRDGYGFDNSIPIYSAAIILNSGYPAWDYSIRMNKTVTNTGYRGQYNALNAPLTDTPATDESLLFAKQIPGNSSFATYSEMFTDIGYFALTDLMNSYISTRTCQTAGKCDISSVIEVSTDGVINFPNESVKTLGFWSLVGFIFGLLIILALLYPIANVIKALVQEKETKIREGMMMMSLRSDVLWLSWWLHNLFLFIPLAIILTIIGTSVFVSSNPGIIFIYFILFFTASISYSIFISTIFSTSRSASIIGSLLYFGGFIIYLGMSGTAVTRSGLLLASLHPSAAFCFGTLAFIEYEDNLIGVTANTIGKSTLFQISFGDTLGMLVVDTIYLLVLSWYLAHVMPSEFGTPKKWYFCFLPSYWLPNVFKNNHSNNHHNGRETGLEQVNTADDEDCPVEGVTENLASQKTNSKCVEIIGLRKEFQTNTGLKVAVDGLNLTMYNGQITALLGHNGAGKSTAIAMLTGLIPSDGGVALVE
eukprot:gene5100-10202_t